MDDKEIFNLANDVDFTIAISEAIPTVVTSIKVREDLIKCLHEKGFVIVKKSETHDKV